MKVEVLDLVAFGPFDRRRLDLVARPSALNLVYGPNEAGKSSALRALKALLYGIEERTPDHFIHPNERLRIAGRLRNSAGEAIEFTRRKGRKNTLLDADGEPIDPAALSAYLHGVSGELFSSLFGIDHHGLRQGGQAILDQHGDVGQALYSAALGNPALHRLLGELDAEADALFRPRGSKQVINAALKAHAEISRELRERSLSAPRWEEQRRALERTEADLAQVQQRLADDRSELNRLRRLQRLLPKFARCSELRRRRTELGEVTLLAGDFGQRRQRAQQARAEAEAVLVRARPRHAAAAEQLAGLAVDQSLLDQADRVDELHTDLGSYAKALKDRPHLVAERQRLLADASLLVQQWRSDLGLEQADSLAPVLARRQRILDLGGRQAALETSLAQAEQTWHELDQRLGQARGELATLAASDGPGPGPESHQALRRAVQAGRRLGDIDARIAAERGTLGELETALEVGVARLGLVRKSAPDLLVLAVPARDQVAEFQAAFDRLGQRRARALDLHEQATDELRGVRVGLDGLQRGGQIPTEAELDAARQRRDRLWQRLRRRLTGPAAEPVTGEPDRLAARFEERLADADSLADRLRREGKQVLELARLQAAEQDLCGRIDELEQRLQAIDAEQQALDRAWHGLWVELRIDAGSPAGMRAWLEDLDALRDRAQQWHNVSRRLAQSADHRATALAELVAAGQAPLDGDGRLDPALAVADHCLARLDRQQRRRDTAQQAVDALETERATAERRRQHARQELDRWRRQWRTAMAECGLPADSSPSEASGFFDTLREMFTTLGEAEKLAIRVAAIDADAVAFGERVDRLVGRLGQPLAEQLAGRAVDDRVNQLHLWVGRNRGVAERRRQVRDQLEQAAAEMADAGNALGAARRHLAALATEAGCEPDDRQLERAEALSAAATGLTEQLQAVEAAIVEAGDGSDLARLTDEVDAFHRNADRDRLPAEVDAVEQRIDQLEQQRIELAQAHGRQKKELELMNGGDRAARLADQIQATLATIREDAEQYVRLRLAARLLRDQVERYRRENQGPLIKRAGACFADLTLGSFSGLVIDFDERDQPVLAGLRPDDRRVPVEGLSVGSRDQLYLALRLATLERYLDGAEPMPFIVDDLLVDFDDRRSAAALSALADLAQRTQVILFTHHQHLVTQAEALDAPVTVHRL